MKIHDFESDSRHEDPDLLLSFQKKTDPAEDEVDMTPMVDVTFLLLIFFMVTASYTFQKAMEQAPPEPPSDAQAQQPTDFVEITIDQYNTFYVTTETEADVEAPTVRAMRRKVSEARDAGAKRMLITAHVDSEHRQVIAAWDAALQADIEHVEKRITKP